MTKEEFRRLSRNVLFLDGATGTNMLAAGMPRGTCTEKWIMEHRPVIRELQRAYVRAGSQIIYAPTFGANRISLRKHHLEDRIRELNTTLLDYAREAADGQALVAGDITTTGKILGVSQGYDYTAAYDNYCEQVSILAENGADLIVAETMISDEETMAIIDACTGTCDLPVMCSVSVNADGTMYFGGNICELAPELEEAGVSAVGINCSSGPDTLESVVKNICRYVNIPVIAKPNAGLPVIDNRGRAIYKVRPEEFAEQMIELHENGAGILGGCCGTTPEFIRELVKAVCPERVQEEG